MIEGSKKRFFIPRKLITKRKNHSSRKKIYLIIGIGFFAVIFSLVFLALFVFDEPSIKKTIDSCGDGTAFNSCSERKPYFCNSDGILVQKSSECGCPEGLPRKGDSCLFPYQSKPKDITLNYTLRGNDKSLDFTVYERLNEYLSDLPVNSISTNGDDKISRTEFKIRDLEIKEQEYLLDQMVVKIQNEAPYSRIEQARIAVSIAQNLEWGWSGKTVKFKGFELNYSRYPYEVLSDRQGVCGEKSELLAYLLKELGYGVSLFYHADENHEAIGVKCPLEESWHNTGYCFVETTGPAIISDSEIVYTGGLTLDSDPEVLKISDGLSLPEGLYEYEDAEKIISIREDRLNGGIYGPFDRFNYNRLEEKYGLADEYNPA